MASDELYHYRTKGSKNGVSTDPNYTPIGKRAQPAWMPGSAASRQYRNDRQQQARIQAEENVKRMKSTVNSGISRFNSAASKTATAVEDARIKRELARREAEKKRQQWVQDRKDALNRGNSNIKSGLTSTANKALKKSGARLKISDKRGVGQNPYEQGYTGVSRSRAGAADRAKYRQERIKQAHEDAKAGKYGKLAAARAYGKEGFEAASRLAKNARSRLVHPGQLRSDYYKAKYNISRNIADAKKEAQQSEAYKRTKAGVKKMTDTAKKTAKRAADAAAKAGVKERASATAKAVGDEAERLKKKGLSILKKLRK